MHVYKNSKLFSKFLQALLVKMLCFLTLSPSPGRPLQCHEAMIEGTHPVTREEAVQLAALHSQIQFGNYEEARFKKGFLKPWYAHSDWIVL